MLCNLRDLRRISVLTCQRNESPPRLKGETGMLWSWVRFGSCFFFSFLFSPFLFSKRESACMYVCWLWFCKRETKTKKRGGERERERERMKCNR